METPFPPFDPGDPSDPENTDSPQHKRLRDIPFRMLAPNLITLMAIVCGLTSIRLAVEDRFELAIFAILFAAILDGLDGRVARLLKSSTRFGAEMDSLADFVNFGVAPAVVLYIWALDELRSIGWIAALIYAICGCLRLARFNVMLDNPNRPKWQNNFFTGVPAPAGAIVGLLPIYLGFLGLEVTKLTAVFIAIYIIFVGLLMVSNLPTFSGKTIGKRISRELVLPVMIVAVFSVAVLFSFPWMTLSFVCIAYLATLPFGYRTWQKKMSAQKEKES
jgi:CDP-diacylglycerol--serine O-phosphatidyltransferase